MEQQLIVDDRSLEIDGRQIFTRGWSPAGDSGLNPILLLHDSLGSVGLWRDFPAMLCERTGRRVVAYDRAGFGQSDPERELPSRNFIHNEAITVQSVALQLNLERFVIFGHSVGGAMALETAAQFPRLISAVISESAQAFVEGRTLDGIRAAKAQFAEPGQIGRLAKWHGSRAQWVLDAWTEVWLSDAFADWSLLDALPKVECPMLVIHGENDEYGSRAFPEMIASKASGASVLYLLKDIGHVPHREDPAGVLELIAEFLEHQE